MLALFSVLPKDPGSVEEVNERFSRPLERFRWLIYGVIIMGIVMLLVAWVAVRFTP